MEHEEASRLRRQLMTLQRRIRREMRTGPVALSDALVLGAIERRGGAVSPGQIAEDLVMTTSNVAAALRALEAAGLISRQRDANDARRVRIELTDDGRRLVVNDRRRRDDWLCATINTSLTPREQKVLRQAGELMGRLAYEGLDHRDELDPGDAAAG
ncbi:MarR family winged helix-turn-helix transcriptional regulator [Mycobacterium interjectum]|uniref:MarR family winged helix-turn-helix transcriptional regulator n=1 Tax=Mycobacterium interjectum TaxID=33895 RepID=UPI000A6E4780|nr:MarR family transcriptional regulator [Mycobacterium interjectum]MCV7089914.1 MarR family transcriptional regulator [Mycobacterium interjectum]